MKHQQGEILPMVKFREIIRLNDLGYNQSQIARSCDVARSTVQDYLQRAQAKSLSYEQLSALNDSEAKQLLEKGRAPKAEADSDIDFKNIHRELQRKGVTLALLWLEGKDQGLWQCSYGGFCRRYRQWAGTRKLSMRQVYKGGDKVFVDYCGVTVPVINRQTGEIVDAQVFVACLGTSNYTFAEATPTQGLFHWIGSHQRAMAFFGGVPACIVPDNLKSGVTNPCRYEPGINRSYQDFAEHYGVAVVPARPKEPRDKAKVEKAVQEVERQILAPLRHETFYTFTELNAAISVKLERLNQRTMKDYGMSRRSLFEEVDQPYLRELPSQSFVFGTWKRAKVSLDYHIEVERHYYSVPCTFARQAVMVKITESLIEVFHESQRIAVHERSRVVYRHTTRPEHMPPEHWAYKTQSKDKFLAWANQVGPHTCAQVQAIFDKKEYEEQAFRAIRGIQGLKTRYGGERLEEACRRANLFNLVGLRRLRSILTANLDATQVLEDTPHVIPGPHENVRGPIYYN
jgi:transposase